MSITYISLGLLLVVILAFEVWMFIDAWNNRGITFKAKFWWLFGMLLLHPIIAIIYYLTDRKKNLPPLVLGV